MNGTNTLADRAANPTGYQKITFDDKLIVMLRNDLDRDRAILLLHQIADRLELAREQELTR